MRESLVAVRTRARRLQISHWRECQQIGGLASLTDAQRSPYFKAKHGRLSGAHQASCVRVMEAISSGQLKRGHHLCAPSDLSQSKGKGSGFHGGEA